MRLTIPYMQIRSDAVVCYWQPIEQGHRRKSFDNSLNPTYSGLVTSSVQKRIISATDLLIQRAYVRSTTAAAATGKEPEMIMNFVTLTLAEQKNLEVRECYDNLLAPWLRYAKSKMGLADYVWKAEYQKRGQVHYHLASDIYLDWKVVRWKWNQLQRKAGYLDGFAAKYKHYNPNGTDVHPMKSVEHAMAYLAKEMCKDQQNQIQTKGKVWDCSNSLKVGRYNCEMTTYNQALLDDAVQHGFASKIETEHCVIFKLKDPRGVLDQGQNLEYEQHVSF